MVAPRTLVDLVEEFGYSRAATQDRLYSLESGGFVHSTTTATTTGRYAQNLWHSGPGEQKPARTPRTRTQRLERLNVPAQRTVKAYPPCNRRDSLVAALFGPAPSFVPAASGMPSPIVDATPAGSVDLAGRHFDQVNQVNQVGER
jgi:hypothetical protein